MAERRSVLILYQVQNGHMDPGYPGFIFDEDSKNAKVDKQSSLDNLKGSLKMIPIIYSLANKMDKVVFIIDSKMSGSCVNIVSPLDTLVKTKLITLEEINPKTDNVFMGGVFDFKIPKRNPKFMTSSFITKMKDVVKQVEISSVNLSKEISNVPNGVNMNTTSFQTTKNFNIISILEGSKEDRRKTIEGFLKPKIIS